MDHKTHIEHCHNVNNLFAYIRIKYQDLTEYTYIYISYLLWVLIFIHIQELSVTDMPLQMFLTLQSMLNQYNEP